MAGNLCRRVGKRVIALGANGCGRRHAVEGTAMGGADVPCREHGHAAACRAPMELGPGEFIARRGGIRGVGHGRSRRWSGAVNGCRRRGTTACGHKGARGGAHEAYGKGVKTIWRARCKVQNFELNKKNFKHESCAKFVGTCPGAGVAEKNMNVREILKRG